LGTSSVEPVYDIAKRGAQFLEDEGIQMEEYGALPGVGNELETGMLENPQADFVWERYLLLDPFPSFY
jgi:hypothetical protein